MTNKKIISYKTKENKTTLTKPDEVIYSKEDAIKELNEIKNLALNCFDKNGNPNISVALKATECKAKIAGLYSNNKLEIGTIVKMGEITIDGEQLRLNIGEELYK